MITVSPLVEFWRPQVTLEAYVIDALGNRIPDSLKETLSCLLNSDNSTRLKVPTFLTAPPPHRFYWIKMFVDLTPWTDNQKTPWIPCCSDKDQSPTSTDSAGTMNRGSTVIDESIQRAFNAPRPWPGQSLHPHHISSFLSSFCFESSSVSLQV